MEKTFADYLALVAVNYLNIVLTHRKDALSPNFAEEIFADVPKTANFVSSSLPLRISYRGMFQASRT